MARRSRREARDTGPVRTESLDYLPGRRMDVYGEPVTSAVLLWHGRGADERVLLTDVARRVAAAGAFVMVPDWDSAVPDGGRAELLASWELAQRLAGERLGRPDRLVLAGWSRGGRCAVSMALAGLVPSRRAVCLASSYRTPDPVTGVGPSRLAEEATPGRTLEVWLAHGTLDDVVPASGARTFHALLRAHGHRAHLEEAETDHAGIVGCAYDERLGASFPSASPRAVLGSSLAVAVLRRSAWL